MSDRVAVARLELGEPLAELVVGSGFEHTLVVVLSGGEVVGELLLEAPGGRVSGEALRDAVRSELGELLWRQELRRAFVRATRRDVARRVDPGVSVVVRTRDRPEPLRACLDSLEELRTPPLETIEAAHEARGELVAFLDHDCVVDPGWLEGLGESFADPLVQLVVGYVGPAEVESRSQAVSRRFKRTVFDGLETKHAALPAGNCVIRRSALAEVGTFAEDADLIHRILLGGYRIAFEPGRIVWRRRSGPQVGPSHRPRRSEPLRPAPAEPEAAPPRVAEPDDPELSVTIASYNRRERLEQVLRALGAQSYPPERYEVVLVLDGSTDGSAEMARSLELPYSLRVLEQENRGLAASRNRGGREAANPIVVWLDDDVVPLPGFLAEHARAHRGAREDHIALGAYPPAPRHGDTNLFSLSARQWWVDYFARKEEPDHKWMFVDFSDGNISAPPPLIFDCGGWDEDFAKGSVRRQDWEFGIRLLERGVRFAHYRHARGYDHFNTSFATVIHNRRVEGHSDVVLVRKHPHVTPYFFMSRVARTAASGGVAGRFIRFAYRRPDASRLLTRPGWPLLRALEAANARRRWRAIAGRMLSHAYLLGVRDGLGGSDLREVMPQLLGDQEVPTVQVELPGEQELPTPAGAMNLSLTYDGVPLGEVPAVMPEEQWDWYALTERVSRLAVPEALGPAPAARG